MAVYCTFRLLTSIAELYAESLKNVFNGLTVLVYLSVMAIGQYYGQQLLSKIRRMKTQKLNAQLMRLTIFIILENIVLLMLLIAFVIRTTMFKSAKEKRPWLWFYLKTLEKVLEVISIVVLCLTMAGKSKKQASSGATGKSSRAVTSPVAAPAAATKRRARKKKPAASSSSDVSTPNPVPAATAAASTADPNSKSTTALLQAEDGKASPATEVELPEMSAKATAQVRWCPSPAPRCAPASLHVLARAHRPLCQSPPSCAC